MLIGRYSAFLDANVLHPGFLRAALLWFADDRLLRPVWSAHVLEEWRRSLLQRHEDMHEDAEGEFLNVDFGADMDSPFKFPDTHSAHAELHELNRPFSKLRIGIVGVGGTGAYILDFLAKTPVKSITLFDDDEYVIKNSFRSPGSTTEADFGKSKVALYVERYALVAAASVSSSR